MTLAPNPLIALPAPTVRAVREVRRLSVVASAPIFVQGALALTYSMPSGVAAEPTMAGDHADGLEPTKPIPEPRPWAARYVQAVVEVLAQQRPVSQLARWTDADVFAELARLQRAAAAQPRETGSRPARKTVVSVHVCTVAADAAEVAARIVEGARSRAIAARLDYRRGRWTCTALTVG
jgi:hypothetical protein